VRLEQDSVRRAAGRYVGPHALQGALYAFFIAPAWIPYFIDPPAPGAPTRLGFWRDHASLYLAGGGTMAEDGRWAGSATVEALRGRVFGEARLEYFHLNTAPQEILRYYTLRVGRLGHPNPEIAAGVTLGYRGVRGPRAHDGVEVGFPFIAGGPNGWVRFETAYVISLINQWTWNHRVQWERRLHRGPYFAGVGLELKSWALRRRGELSHGTLTVLFGTTSTWAR
jgi:hypothetical protein